MKENARAFHAERALPVRNQTVKTVLKRGALQNAILNSENFSSIATDEKGVIQLFNVGAERMLGYGAAEVVDKFTPADIAEPQEVIARANALSLEFSTPVKPGFESLAYKASRGLEDIYELTNIRKDGSRFPAVVSVTALRDSQDRIIGYLLIGTDNTARKQVESEKKQLDQRLREQESYTRSLFDVNVDALICTDPHGVIRDVNNRMEALTGCTRGELLGAPFKKYFADQERAEAVIEMVLREKRVSNYELTVRARDGKETVVSCNATVLYNHDRSLQGMLAAARDITDFRSLVQRLQEKNTELRNSRFTAERANLAKTDFLANMSHELRTPLNAVIGFSEVLQDELYGKLNERQHEYVKNVLGSGKHLLNLIGDILDLSKVEAGKMEFELSGFLLRDELNDSLSMMKEKAMSCGVKLDYELAPDADIELVTDERKLKQILYNLLSNAVKFTPEGGSVSVSARRGAWGKGQAARDGQTPPVTQDPGPLTPDGDCIEISVADTGIGIKPGDMEKLFKPFFQVESGYTKTYEGTGLGLALTKRLVEFLGGRIWAESEFGKGCVFTFTIPVKGENKQERE
jgi:PAS domain S-box-containing protein